MMKRRTFLAFAAAAPALSAPPAMDLGKIPIRRVGKVETVFKSPGPQPNGLQATKDGLWIMDQGAGNKAYLVSYEDGKVLRSFETETDKSSGITFDGEALWIGSTYSREIIRADAKTGETIEKHFTPGAGVIYRRTTDTPPRPDTYGQSVRGARGGGAAGEGGGTRGGGAPGAARQGGAGGRRQATSDGLGVGRGGAVAGNPGPPAPGTGAHGQQTQGGRLWIAVPPGRMIYRIDPKTWMVEHMFPTVGYRPHGIGIETPDAKYLWESDTNMGAFFKRDMMTCEVVDSIVLAEGTPFPHGASVWKGYLYWVDDIGGGHAPVCRVKI